MSAGRVVVVGSLNVDLTVTSVRLPAPGETLLATSVARAAGGKGANPAVAAARAGGALTEMVGAVGQDAEGDGLLAGLAADGIGTSAVARLADRASGLAVITVDASGENTIVVVRGASADVVLDDAGRAVLGAADVVLAQLETSQPLLVEAARARRPGTLFCLNAAPSAALLPELAAEVDLLIVNEHEAADLGGSDGLDSAVERLLGTVPAVLVTLGPAGSRLHRRGEELVRVAAPRVTAVDAVAAGDTYCGVLAARLAAGADDLTAMRAASAAASLAVQRAGAQQSVPTLEETRATVTTTYGD